MKIKEIVGRVGTILFAPIYAIILLVVMPTIILIGWFQH